MGWATLAQMLRIDWAQMYHIIHTSLLGLETSCDSVTEGGFCPLELEDLGVTDPTKEQRAAYTKMFDRTFLCWSVSLVVSWVSAEIMWTPRNQTNPVRSVLRNSYALTQVSLHEINECLTGGTSRPKMSSKRVGCDKKALFRDTELNQIICNSNLRTDILPRK